MKAVVYRKGALPGFRCEEVDRPAAGDDQVLIQVRAASVNPLDWRMKAARPGHDVAGRIEAAGRNVTSFKPGDEVFGTCRGAFAQYAPASPSALAIKPPEVTFEQAASVPVAGVSALQALRDKGQIEPGQHVLINGASGGVGTFAVQIAKSFDARVTGVCSTRNVEMVRSIGADSVVDYTRQDFTRGGERYDLILDCVGNHSLLECRQVLKPRGRYVTVGGLSQSIAGIGVRWAEGAALSLLLGQSFVMFIARMNSQDLADLARLMAAGKMRAVIDSSYPLERTAEAIEHAAGGHARGKVIVTVP